MLLADVISPPVSLHTLLTGWQTDTLSLVSLAIELALAVWYLVSVRRLAARGRSWSTGADGLFLCRDPPHRHRRAVRAGRLRR